MLDSAQRARSPSARSGRSAAPRWSSDQVESIYAAFPRKTGKRKAIPAIRQALDRIAAGEDRPDDLPEGEDWPPGDPVAWLLDRTRVFAKSPAGQAGKYCPHPSTWFSQGRYADDPQEWRRVAAADDDARRNRIAARRARECPEPEYSDADLAFR